MEILTKQLLPTLERSKQSGTLLLIYALSAEALCIGYVFFAGLFTLETLLPTFVTVRLSLSAFFAILVLCTFVVALLGRFLQASFPWTFTMKSPLVILAILWAIGILALSLIKFPWILIPVLIAGFFLSGYLFWHILFEEEK